jgi:cytochrome c oxidase subunit II
MMSALDPAGPQAELLAKLIWTFIAICAVVWVLVMAALAAALLRRRRAVAGDPLAESAQHRGVNLVVGGATVLTAAIVLALTALSFVSHRPLADVPRDAVTVEVTGHQWWWEVRYAHPRSDIRLTSANEIHIPVGEKVRVKLASTDVIHSFWVPNLMGKRDLIPGHDNEMALEARDAGIYRGQCAEFCGLQHSYMSFLVIAQPRPEFEAWLDAQLKPATPPSDPERQKGEGVFLNGPCMMCHAVRGTPAGAKVAPDLTHLASRRYLAAGALPMSRGSIAAWIVDPQSIKPGVHMPLVPLDPDELNALTAYLAGLE